MCSSDLGNVDDNYSPAKKRSHDLNDGSMDPAFDFLKSRPEDTAETIACRELCMGIIVQALIDIHTYRRQLQQKPKGNTRKMHHCHRMNRLNHDSAKFWLNSTSRENFTDFESLCEVVDYDPDKIRHYAFNAEPTRNGMKRG